MAIGKVFLAVSILAAAVALPLEESGAATSESKETHINYRLPDDVKPLHYDLRLIPYMSEDNFTYDGEISINLEMKAAKYDIILHMKELEINKESVRLTCGTDTSIDVYVPESYSYDNETEMMTIHFEENLQPNIYTLFMKFTGILNDELAGFYRCSYTDKAGNTMWIATSHFEPSSARQAFPCFDEPALKATFDISMQHYDNYTALSNMPVLSTTPVEGVDGKVWTKFQTTPMMSTYLVAFVVADFVNISSSDGINNVWTRRDVIEKGKFVLAIAESATKELERYTNSSFRMPKMDHVAVTAFPAGAMENWGLIIYPEASLLYDEEDGTSNQIGIALIAVHELAHQWFGNVVSPSWWSYVWLNEGFAAYFQYYILDKIVADMDEMKSFVVTTEQSTLQLDVTEDVNSINVPVNSPREAETTFGPISYNKAASVLRMLSHSMTEEVFRNGLIKYLDTYQYKAASPSDLWKELQSALDESDVPHFAVEEVMKSWTDQKGYPLVTVHRDYNTGAVTATQEIFRQRSCDESSEDENNKSGSGEESDSSNEDERKWWIPLTYTTQSDADFSNTRPAVWMKAQDDNTTIEGIDVNDWMIVNLQESGYYRVNYDCENWRKIAKYLNSDNYTKIHPLNRAQIMDDSFALVKARMIDPMLYMELINYLSRESDVIPWITMFRIIKDIKPLILHSAGSDVFKPHLLGLMEAFIEATGFEDRAEDSYLIKPYRYTLMELACTLGNTACRNKATELALAYVENPKMSGITPDLQKFINCEGLRDVNESVWKKVFEMTLEDDIDLLAIFSCTENIAILEHIANTFLRPNSTIKESTLNNLPLVLGQNFVAMEFIIDYAIENWSTNDDTCNNSTSVSTSIWNSIIENLQTMKQLNKVKTFLSTSTVTYDEDAMNKKERELLRIEADILTFSKWFQKT